MLVCYVLFHVGGGDVKLMAMLGALVGVEQGVEVLLWTFVLGACSGLVLLIWRVGATTLLARAGQRLLSVLRLGAHTPPLDPEERAPLQTPLFLAPCALAATVIVRFDLPGPLCRLFY
jgi:prepilin peptidase CpaA